MICPRCGEEFELVVKRGRPRRLCYKCRPTRSKHIPPRPSRRQTATDIHNDPHCPWCGAYPATNSEAYPFCNPQHRALLAERVREEAERKSMRQRGGRLGPDIESNSRLAVNKRNSRAAAA